MAQGFGHRMTGLIVPSLRVVYLSFLFSLRETLPDLSMNRTLIIMIVMIHNNH